MDYRGIQIQRGITEDNQKVYRALARKGKKLVFAVAYDTCPIGIMRKVDAYIETGAQQY